MRLNFITTNAVKFENAKRYFDRANGAIELVQYAIDTPEIQDVSCEEIARQSAVWAAQQKGEPCVKMDVGFFIPALGGFPGPFVKYINDWLNPDSILRLMGDESDRRAYFIDAVAIGYPDGHSEVVTRRTEGTIVHTIDSTNSQWAIDAVFIPNGWDIPLGGMDGDSQNKVWGDGAWPEVVDLLSATSN